VHKATWPTKYELPAGGDAGLLDLAGDALRQVRKAKSERKLSMKAEIPLAEALGPAALLERLALVEGDLKAAGRIGKLDKLPDRTPELVIASTF
jgi:valyl-tRNA synthetase